MHMTEINLERQKGGGGEIRDGGVGGCKLKVP